jgi:hypothetical protein
MADNRRKPGDAPSKSSRKKVWRRGPTATAADIVAEIPDKLIKDALMWCAEKRIGFVFTATKDQTAIHFTVLDGEYKEKVLCRNAEEAVEALQDLEEY